MVDNYFTTFYIQQWTTVTDGFGGWVWKWGDGIEFQGLYRQDQSTEMRIAEAQGISSIGTFITGMNIPIEENDVIRRESDGLYFKITGKPVMSPEPATVKIQRMNAERTEGQT